MASYFLLFVPPSSPGNLPHFRPSIVVKKWNVCSCFQIDNITSLPVLASLSQQQRCLTVFQKVQLSTEKLACTSQMFGYEFEIFSYGIKIQFGPKARVGVENIGIWAEGSTNMLRSSFHSLRQNLVGCSVVNSRGYPTPLPCPRVSISLFLKIRANISSFQWRGDVKVVNCW